MGQTLKRSQRLTHSRHFDQAFDQGNKTVGRFMVMWLRSGEDASLRLGVVTSRKVGGAVVRVRARRRIREVFRRNRDLLSGPFDVVVVARASIAEASWDDLVVDFTKMTSRAGLLKLP